MFTSAWVTYADNEVVGKDNLIQKHLWCKKGVAKYSKIIPGNENAWTDWQQQDLISEYNQKA